MDKAIAQELIRLAEVSKASTWIRRDPPAVVAKLSKFELKPSVVQPLDSALTPEEELLRAIHGEPSDIVVLSKNYHGENELRDDHINFILLSSHHIAELAKFWLDHQGMLA